MLLHHGGKNRLETRQLVSSLFILFILLIVNLRAFLPLGLRRFPFGGNAQMLNNANRREVFSKCRQLAVGHGLGVLRFKDNLNNLRLAFAKQVAMNDARVIGRQLARLYPRAHEALGWFCEESCAAHL